MKSALNVRKSRLLIAIAAVSGGAALVTPVAAALAAEEIGIAVTVRNDVTGKIQSQTVKVDNGSNVFGRELVSTNATSSAKIVLKDSTNLNVGPSSSVTLDNFVFKGDSDYKQAGFNLAKGAFRFTSGGSDKRAYDLKTPTASIGVRGTDFVLDVRDKVSHIEVSSGQTLICPIKSAANRPLLTKPNDKKKEKECRKGCAEVREGEAVDVTEACVFSAQYSGMSVGESPMSFAEAAGVGAPGLSIEAVAIGAGIAGAVAGGVVAGTNNNNNNHSGGGDYYPHPLSNF
jgi:hypothetical protein